MTVQGTVLRHAAFSAEISAAKINMNSTCQASSAYLQPLWNSVKNNENLLKSCLFPTVFSFSVNFVLCLPFFLLDMLGPCFSFFHRYKIWKDEPFNLEVWWLCLKKIVCNHVVCVFPTSILYGFMRPAYLPDEAPFLPKLIMDVVLGLLLFDTFYFFAHLGLHGVPWLYRNVHSLHHEQRKPFALTSQYSNMLEIIFLHCFALIATYILDCHPLTEIVFFIVNIWLAIENHCGYNFPWATHRLVPLGMFGGAPFHDLHHWRLKCNYAPYFTHWDRLFNTLIEYTEDKQNFGKTGY
ncbi:cholesterol 25-hydroxylase-like protein [Protopterus annectens]|uniref:cholesterol 25-hydroxylase-like protein n=1 Tax=Protopterus annectens TaxID=7888 RepID=UPI001CFA30B1|nr:cholesterol 25-hydroxylase-like protein [Protopterus annectens]